MRQLVHRLRYERSVHRYLAVGIATLGIDYGLLLLFYHGFHAALAAATTIGFLTGLTVNFLLNKFWTFDAVPSGAKHNARQAFFYALLVGFNLGFTNLFILYFQKIHIGPEVSKLVTTAVITLWNYVLYQKVIFKTHRPTDLERSMM
ncbi:MAG TPA: GtrA family protein [Candidatus Saccharimonadales bacterium]|nr:GtrA family protein [Candidatus Saccharimonadales bacterium]